MVSKDNASLNLKSIAFQLKQAKISKRYTVDRDVLARMGDSTAYKRQMYKDIVGRLVHFLIENGIIKVECFEGHLKDTQVYEVSLVAMHPNIAQIILNDIAAFTNNDPEAILAADAAIHKQPTDDVVSRL